MFDFLFQPLILLGPAAAVFVFAFIMLVIINIFYKFLVNQNEAKSIKERQKELSKKMGEARKSKDMDKVNAIMKEQLSENSRLMKLTIKPMMVSFIVVIIFLPWLNSVYGDATATIENGKATVNLHGINHTITIYNESIIIIDGAKFYEELSQSLPCDSKCYLTDEGKKVEVRLNKNTVVLAPIVATMPFALPILGYNVGWLAWYILVSIPLVIIIRKIMKIYV